GVSANSLGGIAGNNQTGAVIENSFSTGSVTGDSKIGGIAGNNQTGAMIENSFSTGSVTGNSWIGGIAGNNQTGAVIENSFSTGSVTGNSWIGGIAGYNSGTINCCYSSGSVNGASVSIGGLAGDQYGTITNSYSRASVSGGNYVGGLAGYQASGTINNCYSTGTVSGGQKGGLTGYTGGTVTSSYWDTQTSGLTTSYGGTGKTTAQMKTLSTFTGWDFVGETNNGSNDYWNLSTTDYNGYPFFTWTVSPAIRPAIPVSPANLATGLPRSGFNLVWSNGSLALTPDHYNLTLVRAYGSYDNFMIDTESHTFTNILGLAFNPVSLGGVTFDFDYNSNFFWAWRVESVAPDGSSINSAWSVFWIETDPAIALDYSNPIVQSFSSSTFPPTGWTVVPTESTWTRSTVNAFGTAGEGSAKAEFYTLPQGNVLDIISPLFRTNYSLSNVQLSFDYAYAANASYPNRMDYLDVMYSSDRGVSYQCLNTYLGSALGDLPTAPPVGGQFVPTSGQWATKLISLPADAQLVKIRGTSANGNNLYVDNIKIEVLALPAGNGTASNPFQISNVWYLEALNLFLGSQNANVHFKLTGDIDFSGYIAEEEENGWAPIGSAASPFYGHLDGNGKLISGLFVNRPAVSNCGLFGVLEEGSLIENLGIETATGSALSGLSKVGILAGWNKGTISRCFTSGAVIGNGDDIGGMVGLNDGTIINSYSRAAVSGVDYVGGLIGYQTDGTTTNCYATGSISNTGLTSNRGGIIGANLYGVVNNSYWDTQTTGVAWSSGSSGSFGKTTAQMQSQATFSAWNFADVWFVHPASNSGYPQLLWMGLPPALNTPTNVQIQAGATPGTVTLSWDNMLAAWYGIYFGTSPNNISYLGWTANHSITIADSDMGFFQITSGNGIASGEQLQGRILLH
ncbi:MAG: hypothetical protein M0P99_06080, partial [Candidatus Cloacimonetes bacterium]|nr:hypothetical protein [Candidatus Cloacimonadota bacterium]